MEINFYEEFPTEKNLEKLKLIKFQTKIFVATKSLKEFKELEKQIRKIKKDCSVAYWPIIKNSYYISPFANTKDLIELFKELENIKNPLLIDIEVPLPKKRIIENLFSFSKNKKIIKNFLNKNKKRVTVPMQTSIGSFKFMELLGFNYNINYEKNPMFYTSMLKKVIINQTKKDLCKLKNKKQYTIGLGTIAIGIQGNEPILSPENLKRDLEFIQDIGFKKAIIFRLGGLNKKYVEVTNQFAK